MRDRRHLEGMERPFYSVGRGLRGSRSRRCDARPAAGQPHRRNDMSSMNASHRALLGSLSAAALLAVTGFPVHPQDELIIVE